VLVDAKLVGGGASAAAGRGGGGGAAEAADATVEALWAKYEARLTGIVVRHLRADYWHMSAVRLIWPSRSQEIYLISALFVLAVRSTVSAFITSFVCCPIMTLSSDCQSMKKSWPNEKESRTSVMGAHHVMMCRLQDKEQALLSISENAKRHLEHTKTERAKVYDALLAEYR
jgi:hypothetical protein